MILNINLKTIKRVINIILVLLWMIIVFMLSGQVAVESSDISNSVTRWLIKVIFNNISEQQIDALILKLDPVIRKLAHFTLYMIGGILNLNLVNEYKERMKYTKITSIIIGVTYAITDELHQCFVPGRSAEIRDVYIDSLGILLGVLIMSGLKLFKNRMIKCEKEIKQE